MLDHAFGTLGLHRIALFVFEFNERAIRTYKRCGFVVEGRARESIFARRPLVGRDGHERPRIRLAAPARRRDRGRGRARRPTRRPRRRGGASARHSSVCSRTNRSLVTSVGPAPTRRGLTSASSSRPRATRSTTPGRRSRGSRRRSPRDPRAHRTARPVPRRPDAGARAGRGREARRQERRGRRFISRHPARSTASSTRRRAPLRSKRPTRHGVLPRLGRQTADVVLVGVRSPSTFVCQVMVRGRFPPQEGAIGPSALIVADWRRTPSLSGAEVSPRANVRKGRRVAGSTALRSAARALRSVERHEIRSSPGPVRGATPRSAPNRPSPADHRSAAHRTRQDRAQRCVRRAWPCPGSWQRNEAGGPIGKDSGGPGTRDGAFRLIILPVTSTSP